MSPPAECSTRMPRLPVVVTVDHATGVSGEQNRSTQYRTQPSRKTLRSSPSPLPNVQPAVRGSRPDRQLSRSLSQNSGKKMAMMNMTRETGRSCCSGVPVGRTVHGMPYAARERRSSPSAAGLFAWRAMTLVPITHALVSLGIVTMARHSAEERRRNVVDVERDHARQRTEIRDRIWHWQYAMDQQADRATQAPLRLQHEFDGFFFVVALENLRASVAWGCSCCAELGDRERRLQLGGAARRLRYRGSTPRELPWLHSGTKSTSRPADTRSPLVPLARPSHHH